MSLLVSCSLDRYPLDTESVDSYFIDESQLRTVTNLFYQDLLPDYNGIYNNAVADLYFSSNKLDALQIGGKSRITPSSDSRWSWSVLRNINEDLQYIDRCKDEGAVKKYKGLCYFSAHIFISSSCAITEMSLGTTMPSLRRIQISTRPAIPATS